MRRRPLLLAGATFAIGTTAGCVGDGGEDTETATDPGGGTPTEPDGDTPGEPTGTGVSFSVDHAGTELDWGAAYSVTVTAQAGEDPPDVATAILYQADDAADWSGTLDGTETVWRLDAGESKTETYDIEPPAVGEYTLGLMESTDETVVEEWDLLVRPPTAAFDDPISYYDGLDVTVDVELHDWMEFKLEYGPINDEETGRFEVSPKDGTWVKVIVTSENTNSNSKVRLFGEDRFSALAESSQLERPRSLGEDVGKDTPYEIRDQTRHEGGAWLEMHKDGQRQQDGYWYPPDEVVSGAVEEGWLVFTTAADTTVDDLEIRLARNDVRATWR